MSESSAMSDKRHMGTHVPVIVLVDRKTDWFQGEISPDIKKFAWNRKGSREKLEA